MALEKACVDRSLFVTPQQHSVPEAELACAAATAGQNEQRRPHPGFEDSTAGSQWLHAVKMAGLTEAHVHSQPAEEGPDHQQAWVNAQPVVTVLLLLVAYAMSTWSISALYEVVHGVVYMRLSL